MQPRNGGIIKSEWHVLQIIKKLGATLYLPVRNKTPIYWNYPILLVHLQEIIHYSGF